MDVPNNIILYHYTFSPYAQRITSYLALRGIPYAQCLQPPALPRKDLAGLGIKYRRIPLLAIGRDVYCDTRLILAKLDEHFPASQYPPLSVPQSKGLARLLESLAVDGGGFARAAQLIPLNMPVWKDKTWLKDREELSGRSWKLEDMQRGRPESVQHMRKVFDTFETLLEDGRQWIAGTDKPSIADVEAAWIPVWLFGMPGALPEEYFSTTTYPKTFAWVERYRSTVKAAVKSQPKPKTIKGDEAKGHILSAPLVDKPRVDSNDPYGLKEGSQVQFWPIDTGFNHKDEGKLVTLNKEEVAIALPAQDGGQEVHLHAPRWGFRVIPAKGSSAPKL